jgi:hypothetical protein
MMAPSPRQGGRSDFRLTAAVAVGAVVCALALPVLSADDPRYSELGVTSGLPIDADAAQALLLQRQAQAEVELLLAEAMWGEVPPHLYERLLVRIDHAGGSRLAWVDPTGRRAPAWADGPCATGSTGLARDV